MSDTPKDEPPPPIMPTAVTQPEADSEEDWELYDASEQVKKLPARFANRMYINPEGQHIRVAFGERIKDETVYHTTVVVPNGEALEMAQLLLRMATASVNAQITHIRQYADELERLQSLSELPSDG